MLFEVVELVSLLVIAVQNMMPLQIEFQLDKRHHTEILMCLVTPLCWCQGACGGSVSKPAAAAASEGGHAGVTGRGRGVPQGQIPGRGLSCEDCDTPLWPGILRMCLNVPPSCPSPGDHTGQRSLHSRQRHHQGGLKEGEV